MRVGLRQRQADRIFNQKPNRVATPAPADRSAQVYPPAMRPSNERPLCDSGNSMHLKVTGIRTIYSQVPFSCCTKLKFAILPTPMFPICEGITIGIGLSPDFNPLRNEVLTSLRLQMISNEMLAQLRSYQNLSAGSRESDSKPTA
jgi:hypothetical protein